jgi:hypothetical protein
VNTNRKQQGARLRAFRVAAGFRSAREAALTNNWPESSYRAHEAGTRTIGQDDAERYAERFRAEGVDVTAQRILFGPSVLGFAEPKHDYDGGAKIPSRQKAPADEAAADARQLVLEEVPLITLADLGSGDFIALKVSSDAMNRISPPGSTIIVDRSKRKLVSGQAYVFSLAGKWVYQIWRANPGYLEPASTNPEHKPIFPKRKRDFTVIGRVRRTVLDL